MVTKREPTEASDPKSPSDATKVARSTAIRAEKAAKEASDALLEIKQIQLDLKKSEIAKALGKIPKIGQYLELLIDKLGIKAVLYAIAFFGVGPLAYPLLLGIYLKLIPNSWSQPYSRHVIESISVDDFFADEIEKAASALVADNNDRIDFTQLFQQTWTKNGDDRSPIYSFPIQVGQQFNINFEAKRVPLTKPCKNGSKESDDANRALREKIFQVYVLRNEKERISANAYPPAESFEMGADVWEMDKQAAAIVSQNKKATVWVILNDKAFAALECWNLSSSLQVTVRKSLKEIKVKRSSQQVSAASSAPAGSK